MFSEDPVLICDRPLPNEPVVKIMFQKKAIKAIYAKRTYAFIRNHYKKCPDEKVQTGKWWSCLF